MIDRIRETKERELRRMREKVEEEKRKETEKYQFEYDKLREEIQLFARKLGQEENLNKQLSMLNYKLQNNLTDLGRDFAGKDDDLYGLGVKSSTFYQSPLDIDNDTGVDLYARKKAWAELEKEQDEVKSNIKSLMRKAPESTEIDNPLLAERMSNKTYAKPSNYKVPQDVILEKKHQKQMSEIQETSHRPKSKSNEPKKTKSSSYNDDKDTHLIKTKSKERLNRDKSNEDLSMSSQSKAVTQKRKWTAAQAPATTNFNDYHDNGSNQKTGNFNSLNDDSSPPKVEQAKVEPLQVKREESKEKLTTDSEPKKSLFGAKAKKNVFNPFAKKTGPKPLGSGTGTGLNGTNGSFTKEGSEGKFSGSGQNKSGGFGENSLTYGDKSKVSSGGGLSSGGPNTIEAKPQPSFMNKFAKDEKKKVSKSKSGSNEIDEIIGGGDSDYDNDEFDMGSGLG